MDEAGTRVRYRAAIAESYASSCITLKMAFDKYNESSPEERDKELDKLVDGPLNLVLEKT